MGDDFQNKRALDSLKLKEKIVNFCKDNKVILGNAGINVNIYLGMVDDNGSDLVIQKMKADIKNCQITLSSGVDKKLEDAARAAETFLHNFVSDLEQ